MIFSLLLQINRHTDDTGCSHRPTIDRPPAPPASPALPADHRRPIVTIRVSVFDFVSSILQSVDCCFSNYVLNIVFMSNSLVSIVIVTIGFRWSADGRPVDSGAGGLDTDSLDSLEVVFDLILMTT